MGAPTAALATAYDRRLATVRARAARRSQAAFTAFTSSRSWVDLYADMYVAWVAGQVDALAAADMMLAATVLASGGDLPTTTLVRGGYAGTTSAGTPLLDVLGATERVVGNRRTAGLDYADAFGQSARWIDGNLTGDVDRVARDVILGAATGPDARIVGWQRIAEPGACKFCRTLATRGPVYKSQASASMTANGRRYHSRCKCRVEAVADEFTARRQVRAGQETWARMLATGDVPRIPGRSAPELRALSDVNIARSHRLQLEQLQSSIPDLQRRVAAGDTTTEKPLAWQSKRVAELRRLLDAAAA